MSRRFTPAPLCLALAFVLALVACCAGASSGLAGVGTLGAPVGGVIADAHAPAPVVGSTAQSQRAKALTVGFAPTPPRSSADASASSFSAGLGRCSSLDARFSTPLRI
jgi:hypothetical protein